MTEAEVATLISPILSDMLETSGLLDVGVSSGDDHEGDSSLFVDLFFEGRDRPVDTDALVSAMVAARDALQAHGELRFPYMKLHIPDPDQGIAA